MSTSTFVFPSAEWAKRYGEVLDQDEEYRKHGETWTFGAVALVVKKRPEIGHLNDVGVWLDIEGGRCREGRACSSEETADAPFCITGEYDRWKQVIRGELDPVKGMLQGKLKLRGNMLVIVRYVRAAKAMVAAASKVETRFLDEGSP